MGKSSKKSATKVDAAVVAVSQSGKKGKREAEKQLEKAVSAKKQKVERDETVVAKQKVEKKKPKKAASSSSDDDSDVSDDSDTKPKVVSKKTPTPIPAKNGSVTKKSKVETSSDSSDSDDSSDDELAAKKQTAAVKNGAVTVKKTPTAGSSESSDDSSDESDDDVKPTVAPATLKNVAKKDSSSEDSESSDDDSEEEEEKKVVEQPKKTQKQPAESSDSSDSDESSSDEDTVTKAAPVAARKGKVDSSSEEEDDSSDSDDEPKANKPKAKEAKADSSTEESSDDESSDDEASKAQPVKNVQASKKDDSSSSEDDDSDEEEVDLKTPKKKDTDVEMVDAEKSAPSAFQKTPKTPVTEEFSGTTLFVGNLPFSVEESDIHDFFKEAGKVVDIRFAMKDGEFRGFGHVEFESAEAAKKAMTLDGQSLLNRPLRLDPARERGERGAFTPQSRDNSSFQSGGRSEAQTAYLKGFDISLGEDEIRSALQEHFGACGNITRISIPPDHENGGVKGMAYMDFADSDGLNAALQLDGSELGAGHWLTVQQAKPRADKFSSGFGDGRNSSGYERGGGRGSSRGNRGRGDRGRSFGSSRGRDSRGRGRTPFRSNNTAVPSGKKTTFADED